MPSITVREVWVIDRIAWKAHPRHHHRLQLLHPGQIRQALLRLHHFLRLGRLRRPLRRRRRPLCRLQRPAVVRQG